MSKGKSNTLHRRTIECVCLCFIFLLSLISPVCMTASAADISDVTSYKGALIITGYSYYRGASSSSDMLKRFYYSDSYFFEPATVYDEHLASMSLCMAGAAMASNVGGKVDYRAKSNNIRELFDRIGCTDVCVNTDFTVVPGEDTIGIALARKTINVEGTDYTLIPIGIRGAGYEKEWIGNMKVGSTGDAQGFSRAVSRAKKTVDEYIREYSIDTKHVKFWIAGFSRAGAVTDLLTKALTDAYDPGGNNTYGYSFATPQGAFNKTHSYPNSHCTINTSDAVPMVLPSYMGFSHYGDEVRLDDKTASFRAYRMELETAVDLFSVTIPNGIKFLPISTRFNSQREFLSELFSALQNTVAKDRQAYSNDKIEDGATLEDMLSFLMEFMMTSSQSHVDEVSSAVADFQDRIGVGGLLKLDKMVDAVHEGLSSLDADDREDIYAALWKWFKPGFEQTLTEDEYAKVGGMWKSFVYVLFEIAHYDYVNSGSEGFALIGSLMKNISTVGSAHTPEKYFDLVTARDDFYNNSSDAMTGKAAEGLRISDSAYVDALIMKNEKTVAAVNAGRTSASDDPCVYMARTSDNGSDLKQVGSGTLCRNETDDTDRVLFIKQGEEYEVKLTPVDRTSEGLEFQKWVDETGKEVSGQVPYTMSITPADAGSIRIKPVYHTIPTETQTPQGGPNSPERGSSLTWLPITLAALLGTGAFVGGGLMYRRRKKRNIK